MENINSEENNEKNNENENTKELSQEKDDNKITKQEKKKNNKKNKKGEDEGNGENDIDNDDANYSKHVTNEEQINMDKTIELEIKENIPEDILSIFHGYIEKIVNYLKPIFDHYKKG